MQVYSSVAGCGVTVLRTMATSFSVATSLVVNNFNLMLTKDTFVIDVLNAEPKACWEGTDQDVQVKEERYPGGGLMLGYGCYDGNVDLSVAVENMKRKTREHKSIVRRTNRKNVV